MGFCSTIKLEQEMLKTFDYVRLVMNEKLSTTTHLLRRLSVYSLFLILSCLVYPSHGQFLVQPMVIEESVRAGTTFTQELVLQNWTRDKTRIVKISILELTQAEDGSWLHFQPNSEGTDENLNIDMSHMQSCRDWVTINTKEYVLAPTQMKTVKLTVRVPVNARGFYCAAAVASMQTQVDTEGVGMILEMVVPMLYPVQGFNMPHRVSLKDTGLGYQPITQFQEGTDTSYVTLSIENEGGTYSRLNGFAQIRQRMNNGRWKLINSNIQFEEVPIIPGSKIKLRHDLGKVLPSGTYKVTGVLYVDGRRGNSLERDIPYVGSSTPGSALEEVLIQMSPQIVTIGNQPGRVKSESIKILNQSEKPLRVRAYLSDIPSIKGAVIAGHILGEKISCGDWVQVKPAEFLLRKFSSKTLRLTSRMPSIEQRSFYANLNVVATNDEGAFVGKETARVIVQNDKIEPLYLIEDKDLTLRDMSESRHLVTARFQNIGAEYILPEVRARLVPENNVENVVLEAKLINEGKSGMMLPVEARSFASVIDFSEVDYGNYYLYADLYYGAEANQFKRIQRAVIVYDENGTKRARLNPYATASAF